jgi:hypothetical protein
MNAPLVAKYRIERNAAERVGGIVAEETRHVAVSRFVKRDGKNHGQRIDRDGLYQGRVHNPLL